VKLAVFDFDSTLMDGETIDFFAQKMGIETQVAAITHRAMSGELDFFESLQQRVGLLKGLDYETVLEVSQNLPMMRGAKETIAQLKAVGYKVVCLSGGFRTATSHAQKLLGFDAEFANTLHHKEGKLTGLVGGEMMFDSSKGEMVKRLQALLGVSQESTLVVGDGANDRSMFPFAAKRVAFCAKPILKKEANIIIDEKDLRLILEHI